MWYGICGVGYRRQVSGRVSGSRVSRGQGIWRVGYRGGRVSRRYGIHFLLSWTKFQNLKSFFGGKFIFHLIQGVDAFVARGKNFSFSYFNVRVTCGTSSSSLVS